MERRAELGAVVEEYPFLIGMECDRCGLARLDRQLDVLTVHREAVHLVLCALPGLVRCTLTVSPTCASMISGVMCERITVPPDLGRAVAGGITVTLGLFAAGAGLELRDLVFDCSIPTCNGLRA